jgi:hypothetical protein
MGETTENDAGIDERIAALGRRMGEAVAAGDTETAGRLRAEIDRLAGVDPGRRHGSRIGRGSPGDMGLGTDQVSPRRPKAWRPPPRPDLMARKTKSARDRTRTS